MDDKSQIMQIENQKDQPEEESTRYRRGGMIFSLIWIAFMIAGGYFTILRANSPGGIWQEGALAGVYLLDAVIAIFGFILFRAKRMKAARSWLLGSAYFTFFVSTLLRGGGTAIFIMVVMVIGFTAGLVLLTLPFNEARRFLYISFAYSAFLFVLTFIPVSFRAGESASPGLNAGPSIATIFGILVVILIVARARPTFIWFMNQPIRTKMIALIAGLTLLSVGVLFAVNINNTQDTLTADAEDELRALVDVRSEDFATMLAGRVNTMGAFALGVEDSPILAAQNEGYTGTPSSIEAQIQQTNFQWISASDYDALIRRVLVNDLANEARHFKEVYGELFAEVFITDRYGANVAAADRTSDYYQADEDWWQAAYNDGQGAIYIGEAEYDESAGVWGFNIAVPIYSHETGEVLGIIRATALFDQFLLELETGLGEAAEASIVFPSGMAVKSDGNFYRPSPELMGGMTAGESGLGLFQEMSGWQGQLSENNIQILANYVINPAGTPAGASLYDQYCQSCHFNNFPSSADYNLAYNAIAIGSYHESEEPLSNEPTYMASAPLSVERYPYIQEAGWAVMIHEPEASVLAPVRQQTQTAIFTALGVAVVVAGVAAFLAQRIADPIVDLTKLARDFAAGKYDVRAEVATTDEVGQLSEAFNTMAGEVGRRTIELEERSRELEASQRVTFAASERTTPGDFLNLLVNLIADQFDVYHCQVYVVDQDRRNAVLEQSTGYAGRQLLQRGHFIPLDQEALVTRCINTGKPVLVADVSADPSWLSNPLLPYTQSELVVPLVVEGNVFGALDIQDRVPGRFTEQTVAVFTTMTEHVASLFQTTELLEAIEARTGQIEQTARQLRMVAEIAEQLGVITDLEDLLEEAVNQLQASFGFYHAHIYLLDEKGEDLIVRAGSGHVGLTLKREKHTIPMSREASLVARAGRTKRPVVVPDVREEEGFMANPLLPNTLSEVSIPLVSGERLLGVLDLQDEQVDRFSQADVDTLTTLAGQMASSIESAELFSQVEQERAHTEALYMISRELNIAANEDEILEILSRQAMEDGADNGSLIYLELNETGEPEWAEIVSSWSSGTNPGTPAGTRFYLSEFPFAQLWLSSPDAAQFISDVSKSDAVDETTKQVMAGSTSGLAIIPLVQAGRWLGLLFFAWPEPHEFSAQAQDLYEGLIGLAVQAVTTQKARAAQEETYELLQTTIDGVIDPIMFIDTDYVVRLMNKAVRDNLLEEYRDREILHCYEISHHQDFPCSGVMDPCPLVEMQKSKESTLVVHQHLMADGSYATVELHASPLFDEEGNITSFVESSRDITERAKYEQGLVQTDQLKSEFLANMSHELRTPLNSIVGYTDVLLLGMDGDLPEEIIKDVEAIQDNSHTLLGLIDDILDLAKIEAGRMTFEISEVSIPELFNEVTKESASLIVNKPLEIKVDAPADLPTITADAVRVKQIITNLLSNAIKFTDEGTITLRAFEENEEWLVLEVEDTGIGMSEEDLNIVFEKFRQADGSYARVAEGTGLGLNITQQLVQLHGGKIDVKSARDVGSTFTVWLPIVASFSPLVSVKKFNHQKAK